MQLVEFTVSVVVQVPDSAIPSGGVEELTLGDFLPAGGLQLAPNSGAKLMRYTTEDVSGGGEAIF